MRPTSAQNGLLVPVIATGVALLALMWFALIGPKRSENSTVSASVTVKEKRLSEAQKQVADFTASKKRFDGLLIELRRLDIAVPSRADISSLLGEVQRRARLRDSALRLASLQSDAGVATASTDTTTTTAPVIPGATPGQGGLSTLPFTFTYTGRYVDLVKILRAVRDAVTVHSGNLSIDGRLLTVDGITFKRPDPAAALTKVVISATAYIATGETETPKAADGTAATTADPAAPAAPTTAAKAGT